MGIAEEWRNIENFPNYQVSNYGNVKRIAHTDYLGRNRKEFPTKPQNCNGYLRVSLKSNKKAVGFFIHRLVAQAFIENPEKKLQVNHKDGVRNNNFVGNLEWCTASENMRHSFDVLGRQVWHKGKKGIWSKEKLEDIASCTAREVICLDNGVIYKSLSEAERQTGILLQAIYQCCILKNVTAGGFKWSYTNEIRFREANHKDKGKQNRRKVRCIETNIIYESLRDAERDTNICYQSIGSCCRGKLNHAGNLKWEYYNE